MLMYSLAIARFEHSNFFTVNSGGNAANAMKHQHHTPLHKGGATILTPKIRHLRSTKRQNTTTSVLTATTLVYAYRAGITAAAGTRLALCWFLNKVFTLFSFQLGRPLVPLLIFFVTTSRSSDWVSCAPAAFLGCGSRFSGSLSGIPHPRSVTRHNHRKTLPYDHS